MSSTPVLPFARQDLHLPIANIDEVLSLDTLKQLTYVQVATEW
jgi:hypothetical protein